MLIKYSTSTNIVRDKNNDLNYIVTPNAKNIADQLLSDFQVGLHSFSIIGSYGTGKSSFLWAFERNLVDGKKYFFNLNGQFNGKQKFDIINIIGSFTSLIELLQNELNAEEASSAAVLKKMEQRYERSHNDGKILILVIDEFGKLLEHAASHKPEESMYFIQQLAEFCNDNSRDILLITTLHQNFGAYANQLTISQKQEWIKVKGRFKELTFNEPIEQLLFLASSRIKTWATNYSDTEKINLFFEIAKKATQLPHGLKDQSDLAKDLFPLDILSAIILTKALQKYGQNERSLFTFLNDRNAESLFSFYEKEKFFSIIDVFDYLHNNFFSFLLTSLNEDKNSWDSLSESLYRARNIFETKYEIGEVIIKLIGLLNILGEPGGHINESFIIDYTKLLNYEAEEIRDGIQKLVSKKIIYFKNYANRFVITEGTDIDYEAELTKAAININPGLEYISKVKSYFNKTHEIARRASFETGTSRFFEYELTDNPISDISEQEIDGVINIVFNEKYSSEDIQDHSFESDKAIIFVHFPETKRVKESIIEIEKISYVINEFSSDKVAVRELQERKESEIKKLNSVLNESLFDKNSNVKWFFKGDELKGLNKKLLNKHLSIIAQKVYFATPILKNELFNKHSYSSQISTARKKFIQHLLEYEEKPILGFSKDNYPPEKTIYLTLLNETGIHKEENGKYSFGQPDKNNFELLWEESLNFINDTKLQRLSIEDFRKRLMANPFRLKSGFLDFWIPTFLIIHRHDFALFNQNIYVPFLSSDLMDLIWKSPDKFFIKAYNVEGVRLDLFNKYRELINKKGEVHIDQKVFIETIKPFLIFYRDLPYYSKNTQNISDAASSLREAISASPDPESAFFNMFPTALGFDPRSLEKEDFDLGSYIVKLQDAIREIRSSFDELLNRFENHIYKISGLKGRSYKDLKAELIERFEVVDIESLASTPKKLLARIRAPYENRKDFYNSISFALMGKSLEEFNDDDEPILYKSFSKQFNALERVVPIHELNRMRISDTIYGIDITKPDGEKVEKNVIFNQDFEKEFAKLRVPFINLLDSVDKGNRVKIIFSLLKETLENEG